MRMPCVLLLMALVAACAQRPVDVPEPQRWADQAARITIYRDDFGVPHVYGQTDADAVFGLMYAQAEDDFPRIERNYQWAIGRLAETEGDKALYSDLRARLFMTREEALAHYQSAPEWLKALCRAFADGLNYYLHTHPEVEPKLLTRFEPWMPMYFFEGSIGGDIERVDVDRLRQLYVAEGWDPVAPVAPPAADDEPRGSNGIAIAPARSASGNALLLINPHTTFFFRGEVHMVSREGLNAYGAVTWGQFFVYQGFNSYNGWMHTSTHVDIIDEYIETIEVVGGRPMYRYGDAWRPVEVSEVTLAYRDGDRLAYRTLPMFRTHHGPITHAEDGRWVATRLMWRPVRALSQSYLRTKTTGLESFVALMDRRTNSSNNTVFADREGNIAYWHGNFIPRRNPAFDYAKPVDGSNPATDWQGLHTQAESIVIVNPPTGWVQNANSTPFTAAGEHSPKRDDYPPYMAPDKENFRGIHAVRLLRTANDLTLDGLIDLAYDPELPAFELLIPDLVAAYDRVGGDLDVPAVPIEVLRRWDRRVAGDSPAMTLAHFYGLRVLDETAEDEGLSRRERLMAYVADYSDADKLRLFAGTVQKLRDDFGTWQIPWIEVNRYQRLTGAIESVFDDAAPSVGVPMASGRWGALASFGAKQQDGTKKLYGTSGNSFVAVVEFGDRIRAKSLLAGGQSGDPASPHFADQVGRYVDVDFKDVAFYRADVEARAERIYHPGEG